LSVMRVFVLRLCTKFEVRIWYTDLPVQKIGLLGIYCVSISRPGDLDL